MVARPAHRDRAPAIVVVAVCAAASSVCNPVAALPNAAAVRPDRDLDVRGFRVVERESGKDNYYSIVQENGSAFIRSAYRPGQETMLLGFALDEDADRHAKKLRWSWRAWLHPRDGGACQPGLSDASANVYVSWKRGLRWYTLKYVWTATGVKGARCARKRNPFVAQDTIILEAGGQIGQWVDEEIDLYAEYRRAFEDGDPQAAVPELQGIAIMTDGDEHQSPSSADFGRFVLVR